MKHNKLLEVALNKTNRQTNAIREFLKLNKQAIGAPAGPITELERLEEEDENHKTILEEKGDMEKTEYEI